MSWLSPRVPSAFVDYIVSLLPSNEVPYSVRLVQKEAASRYRSSQHTTMHLSEPAPTHAFTYKWGSPESTRSLTLERRIRFLSLIAASGVIANMERALVVADCILTYAVFHAALQAGQVEMCVWLLQRGCPTEGPSYLGSPLTIAASHGQQAMCDWLLSSQNYLWDKSAVFAAARSGHVGLIDWLQERQPEGVAWEDLSDLQDLLSAATHGCALSVVQQMYQRWCDAAAIKMRQEDFQKKKQGLLQIVISAATGSPTPDWRDKVEWLEAQGAPRTAGVCQAAGACVDALERLRWLRQRGYVLDFYVANTAAREGNVAALDYLLAEGVRPDGDMGALIAARKGHLDVIQWLHTHSCAFTVETALLGAACMGHFDVVTWLAENFPAQWQQLLTMDVDFMSFAALSGNVELMSWVRAHGCPWGSGVLVAAAEAGNVEALEWLVQEGCPLEKSPFVPASKAGDLATLRCLRRLDVPWGPLGSTFAQCVSSRSPRASLCWLLEEGCPVDLYVTKNVLITMSQSRRKEEAVYAAQVPSWLRLQPDRRAGSFSNTNNRRR